MESLQAGSAPEMGKKWLGTLLATNYFFPHILFQLSGTQDRIFMRDSTKMGSLMLPPSKLPSLDV